MEQEIKIGAKSTWRGHPIAWDGENWLFIDSKKPLVVLFCDCGEKFSRDKEYLEQKWRKDPLYIWKCKMCDKCVDKKAANAFKNMPKIIECLAK